jgi:EmrB/QacA subfamily drug resistance transporter
MERKWWTLIAVCIATFMLLLDITVVTTALPQIARDLHSTFSDLQWVIDAYSLSLAALLLTSGSLADRLGRRRVFAFGLVIFTLASALCGFATSPLMLTLSRALQGIGGAAMFSTGLALIASAFPPQERGVAIGIWGAVTGISVAVGPLVGGAIVDGPGWEWIFFINIPIGLATLYFTFARVSESMGHAEGAIDWLGTVLFSVGLFALVFATIRGNAEGWTSTLILGSYILGVVLLIGFVVNERVVEHPMFDLTLFRKPAFVGASVAAFVLSASMFGMILYLVLYLQNILHYDALPAGLRFTPVTLTAALLSPVAGRRAGAGAARYFMGGGLALIGIGLLLMMAVSAGDAWTVMLPGFVVAGMGIGLANPALATAAIGVVDQARAGMASGINSTFRQAGTAAGIAIWGAIFEHKVAAEFPGPGGANLVISGVAMRDPQLAPLAERAFVAGLDEILLISGIVALLGAVVVTVLVRPQDFVGQGDAAERPAEAAAVGV